MEYYSAIKSNVFLPFATTWMNLDGNILSEINQAEKDKNHMNSIMWDIKQKALNEQIKQTTKEKTNT